MKKKLLSIICLTLLICNNIINVYAITVDNNSENNNSKTNSNNANANNTQFVKINETVEIDKEINMTLYLDNISYDNFTFKLYSSNSLEDVNTNDIDIKNYNNEEISFDYCINCSSLKTIVLNYKLPKDVKMGDVITFNVRLENKDNLLESMSYRTTVTVIDSIKEENSESTDKEKNSNRRANTSSISIRSSGSSSHSSNNGSSSTTYKGSSNNYLSNIVVKGYTLNKEFIKERLTYFVTVPNDVKSLNISTTKENSNATVNISGNSDFSVGVNKVLITVTSQDGRIKNYRIYVTRMDSEQDEE